MAAEPLMPTPAKLIWVSRVRARTRATATAIGPGLACCVMVLAGCGAVHGTNARAVASTQRLVPARTIPLPAAVIDASAVEPDGYVWVLSGSHRAREITQLQVTTGAKAATVPVSGAAVAIAQASTGRLALGLATATSGAVQLLSATGRPQMTVAVGAPVRAVAFSDDNRTLYVLDGNARSTSVTVIALARTAVTATVGLPRGTVSIAPTPDGTAIWSLDASGEVTETGLPSGRIVTSLSVGGPGIGLVANPAGTALYVLKRSGAGANVGEVDTATSAMTKVLPAASSSVAVGLSLNASALYDYVGTERYGNVQIYDL